MIRFDVAYLACRAMVPTGGGLTDWMVYDVCLRHIMSGRPRGFAHVSITAKSIPERQASLIRTGKG